MRIKQAPEIIINQQSKTPLYICIRSNNKIAQSRMCLERVYYICISCNNGFYQNNNPESNHSVVSHISSKCAARREREREQKEFMKRRFLAFGLDTIHVKMLRLSQPGWPLLAWQPDRDVDGVLNEWMDASHRPY